MYKSPIERRRINRVLKYQSQQEEERLAKESSDLRKNDISRIENAIGKILVKKQAELRPVEVFSNLNGVNGLLLRILLPSSTTDDYPNYGARYSRIVDLTEGILVPGIMVADEYFSGKHEKTIPAISKPVILTKSGEVYTDAYTNVVMGGYGARNDSLITPSQMLDAKLRVRGIPYFRNDILFNIASE